jgi:uncharacterized membrane protein
MKFDFEKTDWTKLALLVLACCSIIPLHVASFSAAIPSSVRMVVDTEVRISLSIDLATRFILVGFAARYLPQLVFGLYAWVRSNIIEQIYYRRGYRRVYVAFSGFGRGNRRLGSTEKLKEYFEKVGRFDRNDARLANFKNSKIDHEVKINFYERHRSIVTVILGVSLFVVGYIGLARGVLVLIFLLLFSGATIFYTTAKSSFRFNLSPQFWGPGGSDEPLMADTDDLLTLITSFALAALLSGFFRVGYLANYPQTFLDQEQLPVSLILTNSEGILIVREKEIFEFVSWPEKLN